MKILYLIFFLLFLHVGFSQERDTLKVMSYNLLNFPSASPNRIDTLKKILAYVQPDIFMVCELETGAGANNILFNALNEDGISYYDMADFVPGVDTQNELYFNSTKLGLVEQNVIPTALRDINEYVLYYKSTDLATTVDTTFFYVYVCHLKASTGFEAQRDMEASALKSYLSSRSNAENVIIGGDFNFYGSDTEPAWNTILNAGSVQMKDPITLPGHWHDNPGFAWAHTQSTRVTAFDGGSFGGMDDRFDFIFIGTDLKDYSNDALYISGSYRAIGQDGLHYNQAINEPENSSEPAAIISALYYMSDHLPVYLEIEVIKEGAGIHELKPEDIGVYYNADHDQLEFKNDLNAMNWTERDQFQIYTSTGQLVQTIDSLTVDQRINTSSLANGTYILKMTRSASFAFMFVKS